MTVKELIETLKYYDEDLEVSFGMVDKDSNSYCNRECDIDLDENLSELNITVL